MNPSPPKKAKVQLTPGFQKSGLPSQLISKLITISGGPSSLAACRLWRRSSRIGVAHSGKVTSPLRLRSQTHWKPCFKRSAASAALKPTRVVI